MSSRRPQGEGSVYRLPDGRWRGVVDLGWHDGKRRRKYITRGTQGDVVRELRRLTAAAEAGRLPIERAPTLGQWLERYLNEVAAPSLRPSTLRRYRQELRLYITRPGQGAAGQTESHHKCRTSTAHSCCTSRRGACDGCTRFSADR
jgi:integrase